MTLPASTYDKLHDAMVATGRQPRNANEMSVRAGRSLRQMCKGIRFVRGEDGDTLRARRSDEARKVMLAPDEAVS